MRIIRYLDGRDQAKFAAQQPDGSALEIAGDILGEFKPTDKRADVKKLLAPLEPRRFSASASTTASTRPKAGAKSPSIPSCS